MLILLVNIPTVILFLHFCQSFLFHSALEINPVKNQMSWIAELLAMKAPHKIHGKGTGAVAQKIKPLPTVPGSHIGTELRRKCSTSNSAPC